MIAPAEADAQPNFAYFVYDGVPAWKGAINPNAPDSNLRKAIIFPSDALQRVPVYHFISSKAAVETVPSASDAAVAGRLEALTHSPVPQVAAAALSLQSSAAPEL